VRLALRLLTWLAVLGLLALGVLVTIGLIESKATPIVRSTELALPGFPAGTRPVRVALLSDIHFGNRAMQRDRLDAIVAQVNAAKPDLVVIVGDFVNGKRKGLETEPDDLIAPLAQLKASLGVIATLGNHEHWTNPARVRAALEAAGVTVLANQATRRGPLRVLGIDDAYTGHDDVGGTLSEGTQLGGVPIAISHSPDVARKLPPEVVLLLAGHSHCGQVVLPVVRSLAPVFGYHVVNPRYLCGIVRDPGRTVIVTAGLGSGSVPVRLGAPPDWWLVTLRSAAGR
jgi:predicted MPP superfamily phosphohydrolase